MQALVSIDQSVEMIVQPAARAAPTESVFFTMKDMTMTAIHAELNHADRKVVSALLPRFRENHAACLLYPYGYNR
ncbi:hypothetical protein THIOKS1890025 [Thiocapsa sp. KS1]|nr:hypothetical protein THIOKS1890025 [Thiocapsa sp. KS1]